MSFSQRSEELEILDRTSPPVFELGIIYKDISTCNRLLGAHNALLKEIKRLNIPKNEAFIIQDIGCGNGELLRYLAHHLATEFPLIKYHGIDLSATIIEEAKTLASEFKNISFSQLDVLKVEPPVADLVLISLTLHHFSSDVIPQLIQNIAGTVKRYILIADLQRSRLSYFLFGLFAAVFLKHPIAVADGKTSIKKGFIKKELVAFSLKLPNYKHDIAWRWAFRYHWLITLNTTNK
ncbi:hypothetical protein GCM10011414_13650 [Croceivirga lutea]|uniref:class I SAM-dependent methyltransferase n=1 Tax=Croceivirga lutea TaxID=1775167 RepID=UPI00163A09FE|nr:class I SAM-dependent methyltransferase [Croceivirga lutea]GGG45369.1 hypothetical protein GCM10011414_13650 [Croceivirga lutea]